MDEDLTGRSHVFTLRLWLEELGGSQREWRGWIQNIKPGQAIYFRDWQSMIRFLQENLGAATTTDSGSGIPDRANKSFSANTSANSSGFRR